MFRKMIQEFGTIDILVNNAGLQKDAPIDQMSLADRQFVLDVNLTGQFLCAREAVREFKRRGIRKEVSCAAGKIICMSSVHEVIPCPFQAWSVGEALRLDQVVLRELAGARASARFSGQKSERSRSTTIAKPSRTEVASRPRSLVAA